MTHMKIIEIWLYDINPPYGVSWRIGRKRYKNEYSGVEGRFDFGLPSISDGTLLFVQHLISKMESRGSKIGLITNGSPLFFRKIRKWRIWN